MPRAAKKTQETPPDDNPQSKAPTLAGGNTIRQAEKPSKAPITLGGGPELNPTHEQYEQLKREVEKERESKLALEKQLSDARREVSRLLAKANDFKKILSRQGIGSAKPLTANIDAQPVRDDANAENA